MKKFNLILREGFDSKNLFEKINILEYSTIDQISNGMQWVMDNNINAVLIGGTAVISYLKSGRDLTPDVDFLVSDLKDLKQKLTRDGYEYSDLKSSSGTIGITVEEFNIDFLIDAGGNKRLKQLALNSPLTTKIGGVDVKVINPELLTIMKIELGREKDLEDGFKLIRSRILDMDKYLKYVELLKDSLNDYDSLKGYVNL